jgi:hypothetical protein
MKKLTILLYIFCSLVFFSCKKEQPLAESAPLQPDYSIPQGKSPADNRIVALYAKYNSYFLYDFTFNDFMWNQTGVRLASIKYTPANAAYADSILDVLNYIWFKFYPEKFLAQRMPYKVFMTDSLYSQANATAPKNMSYAEYGSDNIAIGYTGASLPGRLTPAFKLAYKTRINIVFWTLLLSKNNLNLPSTFFDVSTYLVNTTTTLTDPEYFKTRGFVVNSPSLASRTTETNKQADLLDFTTTLISTPKTTWDSSLLTYPLIKKKYEILTAFMLKEYGIDLQSIGNATY